MKKITFVLLILLFTSCVRNNYIIEQNEINTQNIYNAAKNNNTNFLMAIRNKKLIDIENDSNQSALCMAIADQNKFAYNLLLDCGASKDTICFKKVSKDQLKYLNRDSLTKKVIFGTGSFVFGAVKAIFKGITTIIFIIL